MSESILQHIDIYLDSAAAIAVITYEKKDFWDMRNIVEIGNILNAEEVKKMT